MHGVIFDRGRNNSHVNSATKGWTILQKDKCLGLPTSQTWRSLWLSLNLLDSHHRNLRLASSLWFIEHEASVEFCYYVLRTEFLQTESELSLCRALSDSGEAWPVGCHVLGVLGPCMINFCFGPTKVTYECCLLLNIFILISLSTMKLWWRHTSRRKTIATSTDILLTSTSVLNFTHYYRLKY